MFVIILSYFGVFYLHCRLICRRNSVLSPCLSAQFETNILPLYCGGNKIRKKERLLKLCDVNRLTMKILGLTTSSSNIFNHRFINCYRFSLPLFECKVCGRKKRLDHEVSCTGDVKRNIEKSPWCCGQPMIEAIDD